MDEHPVRSNTRYADIDGVLYSKDYSTLLRYPSGKDDTEFVIGTEGRTVDTIGEFAFYNASKLTSVTINVQNVGNGAFQDAIALQNVVITDKVESIGQQVFGGTIALTNITVDAANTYFDSNIYGLYTEGLQTLLFYKLTNINNSFTVTPGTTKIDSFAFMQHTYLQRINTNGVTEFADYAFAQLVSLNEINMNTNLTKIGEYAFYECTGLTTITLPSSVTNISGFTGVGTSPTSNIFTSCANLTTINVLTGSIADQYVTAIAAQLSGVTINRT